MTVDKGRREFVRGTLGAAATGALGTLAGCTGGEGDGSETEDTGGSGSGGTDGGDSGGTASKRVRYWSTMAAENASVGKFFQESMKTFEEQHGNVRVDLQTMSVGDIKEKLPTAVTSGNAPDAAEGGSASLPFYFDDRLVEHGKYIEGASDLPDKWDRTATEANQFRGDWWSGGNLFSFGTMLGLNPKPFKQVGVEDPSELSTWTGFRRAVDKIDSQLDTIGYEETGTPGDLESYWGQARTAYTDGTDPWFQSEKSWQNPEKACAIGDRGRTDGMIKNCIDMAKTYSSQEVATRGDEDIPSLMLTGRVASFTYGLGNVTRYKSVKDDVTFGWDGDIYQRPIPKLDPNYGKEFDIDELAGKEGQHGGHTWSLERTKQIFKNSKHPDTAWELVKYTNVNKEHVLPLLGNHYFGIPSFEPRKEELVSQYDLTQIQKNQIDSIQKYGPQYNTTGAAWDLKDTSTIRWTDINETISQAIAGQHQVGKTPELVRKRVLATATGSN